MFRAESQPMPTRLDPRMQPYPAAPTMGDPRAAMMGQGQMTPEMLKRLAMMRKMQGQGAMHASAMGLENGRGLQGPRPMQAPMLPSNGVLGLIRGKQASSQLMPSSTMNTGVMGPKIGDYQSPTTVRR